MIKICISGLTGSGKTAIAERLEKELNILHVRKELTKTFRDAVAGKDIKDPKVASIASDPKYATQFDDEIVKMAEGQDCVLSTWLGPWFIKDATLRVWLDASVEERVRRVYNREKTAMPDAIKFMEEKDKLTVKNFKKDYNINIMDHEVFDLEINTEKFSIEETVALISMVSLSRDKKKFE